MTADFQNAKRPLALPAGVWALGFVSLFMDISSEMIHSLLPAFLVTVVGVSALTVGLIEGVAESTAALTKLFSGALSDHWGRRKPLALLGYGMAALTKPMFPLADSAMTVLAARFADRIGKGIRGAPRDALVADLTAPEQRGAAFGLRQSLDTVGAFLGPLLAIGLMLLSNGDMRLVFWVAVIPAFVCVAVLWLAVREPPPHPHARRASPLAGFSWRSFPPRLWGLVAVVALFTLTRFSEAFLVLRAQDAGWALAYVPLVLVLMNLAYAASAYPFGKLSDRLSRRSLLALGCGVMVLADLCLAFGDGLTGVAAGVLLWGLHMGLTEGLLNALVADYAPAALRGTAFGVMNLARGVMLLPASLLAGALWSGVGASATFLAGAAFAVATILAVLRLPQPSLRPSS
ncbi:MAG: MFS transporter [Gammaproteobacteria bacterium]|nr:MFS transporter [Gammaproteobacteria bacterium]